MDQVLVIAGLALAAIVFVGVCKAIMMGLSRRGMSRGATNGYEG